MTTYYKAVRPDGTDFRTGTVVYAAALASGAVLHHPDGPDPSAMVANRAETYLSVSVEPGETLIGGTWPCRLLVVEPVGPVLDGLSASPYKRACRSLRVVGEVPAHLALGPNGAAVAALIDQASRLTAGQIRDLAAAWDAAGAAARTAARTAARDAAGAAGAAAGAAAWDAAGAAGAAAGAAALDAAFALVTRDLITPAQFTTLYGPWATVIGATA